MTRLYLVCGLPASGKSSLCKLRQGRIITADIIRLGVVGNTGDSMHDNFVWDIALNAVDYFLQFSDVYYDATNSTIKRRAPFIEVAKRQKKEIVCVWVNTPKDLCIKQNQKRTKALNYPASALPDWVIENVSKIFEPPTLAEGYEWIEEWTPNSCGYMGRFTYRI